MMDRRNFIKLTGAMAVVLADSDALQELIVKGGSGRRRPGEAFGGHDPPARHARPSGLHRLRAEVTVPRALAVVPAAEDLLTRHVAPAAPAPALQPSPAMFCKHCKTSCS